jgi:hypothetical protein
MLYRCSFCAGSFEKIWRCKDCGMFICDNCSKGGKSTDLQVAGRILAGFATYGASELIRAGYRQKNQKCTQCDGSNLILL